jgi:hypothetical protein
MTIVILFMWYYVLSVLLNIQIQIILYWSVLLKCIEELICILY